MPGIPLLAALLGGLFNGPLRRAVIVITIAGFLINAPTLFAFYERYYAESSENGLSGRQVEWSMRYTPFLHGWPAAIRQVQNARQVDVHPLKQLLCDWPIGWSKLVFADRLLAETGNKKHEHALHSQSHKAAGLRLCWTSGG